MDLWTDRCLVKANFHRNSPAEVLQLQRASEMHCIAFPYDRAHRFQDTATNPHTSREYYDSVFSLAEHVQLPPSPTPADTALDPHEKKYPDLNNIRFPSLDDGVADIVLDPHDKTYPDLKDFECPSLDEEVAFLMSRPFCAMPWEVPLPPSPTPVDAARHERCFQEKNYPHSTCMCFSSLDEDVPKLMDLNQLVDVPLPPSPTPADIVLDPHEKEYPDFNNIRKKYQDLTNIKFPSLDDEVDSFMSLPVSVMPSDVPLPPSPTPNDIVLDPDEKRYPDFKDFECPSLDEEVAFLTSRPFHVMPWDVPLPPSPTPVDAACHERCFQEENYLHSSCTCFSSLDEDIPKLMDLNQLAEVPLPPSPTPADIVLDPHEKEYPDLNNIRFPSLDDEVASFMSLPISVMPPDVPLPPSPTPTDIVLEPDDNRYLDLQDFECPFLDEEVAFLMHGPFRIMPQDVPLPPSPTPTDTVLDVGQTNKDNTQDWENFEFPPLDDEMACLMSRPVSVSLPPSHSLDDDAEPENPNLLQLQKEDTYKNYYYIVFFFAEEVPLPPSPTPTDAARNKRSFQEENYPHSSCTCFSSLDGDVLQLMDLNQLAEVPLPPSPTPADAAHN